MLWYPPNFVQNLGVTKILRLPEDLAEGLYRLEIVVYDSEFAEPFGLPVPVAWFRVGTPPAAPVALGCAGCRNLAQRDRTGRRRRSADGARCRPPHRTAPALADPRAAG